MIYNKCIKSKEANTMKITMKNDKNAIQNINDVAEYSVERAAEMVKMLNLVAGTMYCIIDRRVSFFEDANGRMVEPYKPGCYFRDAEFAF